MKLDKIIEELDWMNQSALHEANNDEEAMKMSGYHTDNYEVYCDMHLSNGHIIHMRNHCFESYLCQKYIGDGIDDWDDDGYLHIEYYDEDGRYHQVRVMADDVVMLDMWTESVHIDAEQLATAKAMDRGFYKRW